MNQVQARPLSQRREAALERLRSNTNLWLATASDGRGPHLIPVSYWWDGSRLTTATLEGSRTWKNVRVQPKVRASIGSTIRSIELEYADGQSAATLVGLGGTRRRKSRREPVSA